MSEFSKLKKFKEEHSEIIKKLSKIEYGIYFKGRDEVEEIKKSIYFIEKYLDNKYILGEVEVTLDNIRTYMLDVISDKTFHSDEEDYEDEYAYDDSVYYDEDGYSGKELYSEICDFWEGLEKDTDLLSAIDKDYISILEIDLSGGRDYYFNNELYEMAFNYFYYTKGIKEYSCFEELGYAPQLSYFYDFKLPEINIDKVEELINSYEEANQERIKGLINRDDIALVFDEKQNNQLLKFLKEENGKFFYNIDTKDTYLMIDNYKKFNL